MLKRGGKVYVVIIPNAQQNTPMPIIRKTIEPDSIVYTDGFQSYDALDLSEFRHHRINHTQKFVEARTHINGIENWPAAGLMDTKKRCFMQPEACHAEA